MFKINNLINELWSEWRPVWKSPRFLKCSPSIPIHLHHIPFCLFPSFSYFDTVMPGPTRASFCACACGSRRSSRRGPAMPHVEFKTMKVYDYIWLYYYIWWWSMSLICFGDCTSLYHAKDAQWWNPLRHVEYIKIYKDIYRYIKVYSDPFFSRMLPGCSRRACCAWRSSFAFCWWGTLLASTCFHGFPIAGGWWWLKMLRQVAG